VTPVLDTAAALGPWLRGRREQALLTQEQLAECAQVSVRTVRNLESGRVVRPQLATVRRLAAVLGAGEEAAGHPGGQPLPAQLPPQAYGFAGRDAELGRLDAILDSTRQAPDSAAVIAVAGTAGVGKTALAVRWAHRVRDRFPDGQLYVDLRGYGAEPPLDPGDVLATFLRDLGVDGAYLPPSTAGRAALYRSLLSARRMLVVLDNAAAAEQVVPLLPGPGACAALVTSRDSLVALVVRYGARRLELDLLPPGEAAALLRALIGARADAHPGAVDALATACAGLPLALRVVAELVASRPDDDLGALGALVAQRCGPGDPLDLCDAGGDPGTAVRAVFGWSYQRLPPDLARVFSLLGLHSGADFDAHVVAALAAVSPAEAGRMITGLVRAHLVRPAGAGRFALHGLLRAYAAERAGALPAAERGAALARLISRRS
jgi:transcriptional regulator with XRE-family HTH domain